VRAVWLTRFGGPEVLVAGEAPDPVPGAGQMLIEVAHASITFVETQLRGGRSGPVRLVPPVIPGNGVGGVITAVGDAADAAWLGRRVVTSTGGSGGYAEQAVGAVANVVVVPEGLALDVAVALLADGRTALMIHDAAAVRHGERVLVEAAAGGVGTLLLQLAHGAGGRVVAAAGGAHKLAAIRKFGPHLAVVYGRDDWSDAIRAELGGLDVVLDGVGGAVARRAFELLGRGGRLVSYGAASGALADVPAEAADSRGVEVVRPRADPARLRGLVVRALAEAAEGRLHPVIGQRFALDRAADAHAAIESRATIGKTLLDVRR
jgi:NADPH:quinone reductase